MGLHCALLQPRCGGAFRTGPADRKIEQLDHRPGQQLRRAMSLWNVLILSPVLEATHLEMTALSGYLVMC